MEQDAPHRYGHASQGMYHGEMSFGLTRLLSVYRVGWECVVPSAVESRVRWGPERGGVGVHVPSAVESCVPSVTQLCDARDGSRRLIDGRGVPRPCPLPGCNLTTNPSWHRTDVMPSRNAVAFGAIFYPVAIGYVATTPSKRCHVCSASMA